MSRNQVLVGTATDYVLFMQGWLLKTLFGDCKKKGILIVIPDALVTAITIGAPSILFVLGKTLGPRKWRTQAQA